MTEKWSLVSAEPRAGTICPLTRRTSKSCLLYTSPASIVYNDGKILQISPGSTNPKYTEQGFPDAFRICGRDDQQGPVAAKFMHDVLKLNKIAILHNKTAYGEGLATEVQKSFEAKGGTVTMFQGIGQDENDFRANISVIKGSGAEGFFWGGMYGQGCLLYTSRCV